MRLKSSLLRRISVEVNFSGNLLLFCFCALNLVLLFVWSKNFDEEEEPVTEESRIRDEKEKMENLLRRLTSERVPLRVHDVLIKGNTKTKDQLI